MAPNSRSAWVIVLGVLILSEGRATEPPVTDLFIADEEPGEQEGDAPLPTPWRPEMMGIFPSQLPQTVQKANTLPLAERLEIISGAFLKRPYAVDPLGEGESPDADPVVRYDAFDCLTYVEEVLALANTGAPHLAGQNRSSLRYKTGTRPQYATRNHFMELQWIPNAIQTGWLRDITSDFNDSKKRTRQIDASTWKKWRPARNFPMNLDRFPTGSMSLTVVPVDAMLQQMDKIPSGAIMLVVREDVPHKPIWVSHIGFVFHKDKPFIRHASKLGGGSVRDNSLKWYLSHLKGYKYWRAAGVTILAPVESGPRLSRLRGLAGEK